MMPNQTFNNLLIDNNILAYNLNGTTLRNVEFDFYGSVSGNGGISNNKFFLRAGKSNFSSQPPCFTYSNNTNPSTPFAAQPIASVSGNICTVTCATSGATIRYTTDGSVPTSSSATVSNGGTITVSDLTSVVNVKAFAAGYNPSSTTTRLVFLPTHKSPIAIDLSHSGNNAYAFGQVGDQVNRYQTFTANTNPNLSSVDIRIKKVSGSPVQPVTVGLYNTSGGVPMGSALVSATVNASTVSTSWTTINVPLNYSGLVCGNQYAIVLGQQTPDASNFYAWCSGARTIGNFGKWNGPSYVDETSICGNGWLMVYVYTPSSGRVLEAEGSTAAHQCGRADGIGWSANVTQDNASYMLYGPYWTDVSADRHTATFRLKEDNNTANNDAVVRIEVNDTTASTVIASQTITRQQFSLANTYQDFTLLFNSSAGHQLEFRVYWLKTSYINVDKVTIF